MPSTTTIRRTGLLATVIDDNLNSWVDFAAGDINIDVAYQFVSEDEQDNTQQNYWGYRGQAGVCARTTDGAIVRVRIGDGSSSDRTIYRQIITDPTDAASWESWTQLYTGDHFAVAIEADAGAGAGYRVYHAKSTGLYMDNVLKITRANIVRIKPTAFDTNRIFYQTVSEDAGDSNRVFDWWYTPDITAGTPDEYEDCANYRWYRSDLLCMNLSDTFFRFRALAHEAGSRDTMASQSLTVDGPVSADDEADDFNKYTGVRWLKGPSGQAGYKSIENMFITSMTSPPWSGAYYLFYNERHFDQSGNVLSNLKNPLFWSRSVGYPYFMSAPTPVGYSIWGFAGAVEWGDYIYVCGNGRVLRRPKDATEIELTDYIIEGEYDIPRDNQKATGRLLCANQGNAVGALMGMTDADQAGLTQRRVEFGIGQRAPNETDFTYKRDEGWIVSSLRKIRDDETNGRRQQVEVSLGNFWHRLENPFRETISLPGKMVWDDWQDNAPNKLYNYSNDTDEFVVSAPDDEHIGLRTIHSGEGTIEDLGDKSITLFAGWRGENGWVRMLLWDAGGIVFRYKDVDNFYYVKFVPSTSVKLIRYTDGHPHELASASTTAGADATWITVDFRWQQVRIDVDFDTEVLTPTTADTEIYTGFVGTTSAEISDFSLYEWNETLTTKDVLRGLLSYADEHEVELELDEETAAAPIVDFLLGPQSDLDTPEKAFRQILESSKLQAVWLEDEA